MKGVACMENGVVERLKEIKQEKGYTLHELSKRLDFQVTTIARWLKTKRINKIYAEVIQERIKHL